MVAALFAIWLPMTTVKLTPMDVEALYHYAKVYNIPISIAESVMRQESEMHRYAIHHNYNGFPDMGLFQINWATYLWLSERFNHGVLKWPYDPVENIKMALRYLGDLDTVTGSWKLAISAYNGGLKATLDDTLLQSTLWYTVAVLAKARALSRADM